MRPWLLVLFLAAQDKPPQMCTLSGTVSDLLTGEPLGKAELLAERIDHDAPPAVAFTDAKGNFAMVELLPGQYRLKGHRNGYLDAYYGGRRPESAGAVIALEPGQELPDVKVKLAPFGVISGTVRDTDGEPMSGAEVALFRQSYNDNGEREIHPDSELQTDDQGQFRVGGLQPGKYYIRAAAHSLNDYGSQMAVDHSRKPAESPPVLLPTLYPGVTDPAAARTVEVGIGARVTGVDLTLLRAHVFRVSVKASAPPGISLQYAWIFNAPMEWRFGLLLQAPPANSSGVFVFNGVRPAHTRWM